MLNRHPLRGRSRAVPTAAAALAATLPACQSTSDGPAASPWRIRRQMLLRWHGGGWEVPGPALPDCGRAASGTSQHHDAARLDLHTITRRREAIQQFAHVWYRPARQGGVHWVGCWAQTVVARL
jgi:hypothetical protein